MSAKKSMIRPASGRQHRMRGFTLTELAIVLVIVGLAFVFFLPVSSTVLSNQARSLTTKKLQNIETAIGNYVAVNRRLPCPAFGNASTGLEMRDIATGDCLGNQATGVVPWVTVGLTQVDIEDGAYFRITYRAGFGLTRDNALDMTNCDPAGTATTDTTGIVPPGGKCRTTCVGTDMATCTSPQAYLLGKGFVIRDKAGTSVIMDPAAYTGAAFVLISHGDNGYGAYRSDGSFQATAGKAIAGTIEGFNINGPAMQVTSAAPSSADTFRDGSLQEGTDPATYFDDILLRPSVFAVIQKAQLGPRSH